MKNGMAAFLCIRLQSRRMHKYFILHARTRNSDPVKTGKASAFPIFRADRPSAAFASEPFSVMQ